MGSVILDVATIRSACRFFRLPDDPPDDTDSLRDLHIAALGSLLESLVLFDEILVPDLGHQLLAHLLQEAGPAVKVLAIDPQRTCAIEAKAREWLRRWRNIENFIRVLGGHPLYSLAGSSTEYLLLQAIGTKGKYDSQVIQWVRDLRSQDASYFQEPIVSYSEDNSKAVRPIHTGKSDDSSVQLNDTLLQEPPRPVPILKSSAMIQLCADDALKHILDSMGLPHVAFGEGLGLPEDEDALHIFHPSKAWLGGSEVLTFCANLMWTTFRARCYDLVSRLQGVSYMPHPLRARLAGFSMASDGVYPRKAAQQESFTRRYVDVLEKTYQEGAEKAATLGTAVFQPLTWSPLLPYLLKRWRGKGSLIKVAYEVREERGARNLRKHVSSLQLEVAGGNLKAALQLVKELSKLVEEFRFELGMDDVSAAKLSLSICGLSVEIPRTLIPRFLSRGRYPFKSRMLFLRNVFRDLMTASTLGTSYELLYPTKTGPKGWTRETM